MKECSNCQGRKQIMGMGMMREDCHVCEAKGYIEEHEKGLLILTELPTEEDILNAYADVREPSRVAWISEEEPAIKPKVQAKPKAKKK